MSLEHSPARDGARLLRRKQILELLGVSDTTLWRWIREGRFPQPVDLGENTRAWIATEVEDFVRARAEARDSQIATADAE